MKIKSKQNIICGAIYMYICVDICVPKILYMYKISAHVFFSTLLIYICKESFEE